MRTIGLEIQDILTAASAIRPYIYKTPFFSYTELNKAVGHNIKIYVKHENLTPTGSFKCRNALCALNAALSIDSSITDFVAASTGNHGISIAWGASLLRKRSHIFLHKNANNETIDFIRNLGGIPHIYGENYDESLEYADNYSRENGFQFIPTTNSVNVLQGAATIFLEIIEEIEDESVIIVSIGGGSQAAGAIKVISEYNRKSISVIGVQTVAAPAVYESWKKKYPCKIPAKDTIAKGLATNQTYAMTYRILQNGLSDFITVTEPEIKNAMIMANKYTGNLLCGAGSVALAGLIKIADKMAGKSVVIVFSGSGNKNEYNQLNKTT